MKAFQWRQILAAQMCPPFDEDILKIPEGDAAAACEIRLRAGQEPVLLCPEGRIPYSQHTVTPEDLSRLLTALSGYSLYTVQEPLLHGFLPLKGGFRCGVCASTGIKDDTVTSLYNISSMNIRIPFPSPGCAGELYKSFYRYGAVSTLIISPPGMGKTTLLRDLVRLISDDGVQVGLCDERGELAAMHEGTPNLDVGRNTDVMNLCPKHLALPMLLRSMAPQVIAVDEIGSEADTAALKAAALCGVRILASAHGTDVQSVMQRPEMASLVSLFGRYITLGGRPGRILSVQDHTP